MDRRDEYLISLAEVKRCIARAERRLAQWRSKELALLHNIQSITEEVAYKRIAQSDINLERVKSFRSRLSENPRLVGTPSDILTTLTRPSMALADDIRVA